MQLETQVVKINAYSQLDLWIEYRYQLWWPLDHSENTPSITRLIDILFLTYDITYYSIQYSNSNWQKSLIQVPSTTPHPLSERVFLRKSAAHCFDTVMRTACNTWHWEIQGFSRLYGPHQSTNLIIESLQRVPLRNRVTICWPLRGHLLFSIINR